jgi:hypothetical protein
LGNSNNNNSRSVTAAGVKSVADTAAAELETPLNGDDDDAQLLTTSFSAAPRRATVEAGASSPMSPVNASAATTGQLGANRTTILLRGGSRELPGPHCLTIVPDTLTTRWNVDTVLLVLHDLRLASQNTPVTGVFFMDRAHQHVDVMLTSFRQASKDMQLFTLDRLLYALTEYVPCIFAWRHLLQRAGLAEQFAAAIAETQELIEKVCVWVFQRHIGGLSAKDIVAVLERYFERFVVPSTNEWAKPLTEWCGRQVFNSPVTSPTNSGAKAAAAPTLSSRWAESPFEACDSATLQQIAKASGYRFPLRTSCAGNQGGGDTGVRCAASTHETVFGGDELQSAQTRGEEATSPFFAQSPECA